MFVTCVRSIKATRPRFNHFLKGQWDGKAQWAVDVREGNVMSLMRLVLSDSWRLGPAVSCVRTSPPRVWIPASAVRDVVHTFHTRQNNGWWKTSRYKRYFFPFLLNLRQTSPPSINSFCSDAAAGFVFVMTAYAKHASPVTHAAVGRTVFLKLCCCFVFLRFSRPIWMWWCLFVIQLLY